MPTTRDIQERHNRLQDSLLHRFEANLREIVARAQARTIAKLHLRLRITDGVIDPTPANMLVLRNAYKLFQQELEDVGYSRLVEAFVGEFRGTLPFLDQTLALLGQQAGQDWKASFTPKDTALLAGVQANTVWAMEDAMQSISGAAITRGLFGVAGLKFGSLVELLTEKLGTSIARARTIADSGMSTWYRTASDLAFRAIERDVPEQVLRYRYSGPTDLLERPFCRHLTTVNKSYTREEIDRMDNGQFPVGSVFTTGGGWNCRHCFVISVDQWESDVKEPAKAARPAAAA